MSRITVFSYVEESTYLDEIAFNPDNARRIRARLDQEHPGSYGVTEQDDLCDAALLQITERQEKKGVIICDWGRERLKEFLC